ncbi:FecCD family ABC transporter permease [Devosia submarina]|uniref:FecCD family ABC transporter permease n=1 Tax=Devosia submarina TaxID=1173082 RepID=UPI0014767F70|nr:iron ABC transporter permease [Devosia submarina]
MSAFDPALSPRIRTAAGLLVMAILVIACFLVLLVRGTVFIPLGEVIDVLAGGEGTRSIHRIIVMDARLPKAITAVLAGAALGVGGAMMQTLFRNPLADPYVLGVSSGAILGAAIVILGSSTTGWLSGLSVVRQLGITGAAVAGAAMVLILALAFARRLGNPAMVLIVGVMFGFLSGALVDVLVYYADPERLQGLATFTRGTVRDITWSDLQVLAPACLLTIVTAMLLAKPMNILLLGERYAATMGVSVRPVQFVALSIVALLAGVVTAYCGAIGFIGLAAPHLVRGMLGQSDHFVVLPGSALVGAILVLLAEYVAGGNGLTDVTLPLNSVTAFIGAPVVLWVLLRRRSEAGQVPL